MDRDDALDYPMLYGMAVAEVERLREQVSELTALLDAQLGTPCEQVRHQQEIEALIHDNGPIVTERERCADQVKKLLSGLGIDHIAAEVSDRIRKGV